MERLEDRLVLSTFLVETTADGGPGSLRQAILDANGSPDADMIAFDASLTDQTIILGGVELTVSDDLSITGLGADKLTISGNNASRVFSISAGVTVDISDVRIANGSASNGGGIYNEGTLNVLNGVLTDNSATGEGGAIDNLGMLTIANSIFSDNSSTYGGAIVNDSALIVSPSLTIVNSVLTNNSARYGGGVWNDGLLTINDSRFSENSSRFYGGAIVNRWEGTVTVDSSTFSANIGGYNGGAIDNNTDGYGGSLEISNCVFAENSTQSVAGAILNFGPANIANSRFEGNSTRRFGGAIVHGDDTMAVTNCTFVENIAGWYGGAIDNTSYGHATLKIINSTLSGNSAGERGGAIENYYGTLEITNSTISGNSSKEDGGGIWSNGELTITNSTVFGNRANADGDESGHGGGLENVSSDSYPKPVLNNTILAGNVRGAAESDSSDDIYGTVDPVSSHNLIGGAATAGDLRHGINGNIVGNEGSGTIDIAAVLDPNLADNGGPTLTHALVAGSLARNAGDNSKAVDADGNPLVYDQRGEGFARIVAGTVDIGAFEMQPQIRSVEINVKPGSDPNSINLAANGVIAVAIFTSGDFDASLVDASTVVFAGASAVHSALEDVDSDGDLDMVLHFRVAETDLAEIYALLLAEDTNGDGVLDSNGQTTEVSLTGQTVTDEYFAGFDEVDLFLSGKNLRDFLEDLVAAGGI